MIADAAHADAFANGQRQVREADRVALVAALHLPPETTWEKALARVVPVPAEVAAEPTAKGCHGCRFAIARRCALLGSAPIEREVREWIRAYLTDSPDLMTPKPGAPECPGRVER